MRESFKSNAKFRSLVEEISDGIIAIDPDWQIVYVNQTAEKIFNRKAGSLIEKNIWEEFPESVQGRFYQAYQEASLLQKKIIVEDFSKTLDRWIRATVYPSPKGLVVYFNDITNERKAAIRADKSEAHYKEFIDRVTDGFIALDKEFRYVYVNNKIGELVHRDPKSLIGKNVWEEFPDAVNSLTYKAFQTAFKEQRFISNIDYYQPLQLWQENYIYPSPEGLSVFIKDISDRKKLEVELRKKERDQQFEIMIATLEAQEKERTFIGQELHDNVNQLLVASKLMLALIRDNPQGISGTMLSKCIENLDKAIEENRKISHELVTPDLKEQTLVEQLQALLQTMFTSDIIETSIDASAFNEQSLDDPKKLAVYRIAQEQCTNIIKYAKAGKVNLQLASNEHIFTMIVMDDGVGMKKPKTFAGIGLRNIAARVNFFGGDVQIKTKPGNGFVLKLTLPVGNTVPAYSL
ncbi:MAG TPA: PAS domain-containing protein [Flavisolibacter sp.]|jgi:PAS domain S-box-containing protein|nr:PAS domain-containing protein [Flavisolibacter sp.]